MTVRQCSTTCELKTLFLSVFRRQIDSTWVRTKDNKLRSELVVCWSNHIRPLQEVSKLLWDFNEWIPRLRGHWLRPGEKNGTTVCLQYVFESTSLKYYPRALQMSWLLTDHSFIPQWNWLKIAAKYCSFCSICKAIASLTLSEFSLNKKILEKKIAE